MVRGEAPCPCPRAEPQAYPTAVRPRRAPTRWRLKKKVSPKRVMCVRRCFSVDFKTQVSISNRVMLEKVHSFASRVCVRHCFSLDFKTQVSISNELLRLCLKLCFEFSRKSHTHTTLSGDTFFSASTYLEIEI